MFKNMKLGNKIIAGFVSLLLIAALLGGLASWRMWNAEGQSTKLSSEYVPEVTLATEVERNSLLTMYEVRGYGLTEEEAYLTRGRKHLADVQSSLKDCENLADKSTGLVKLKEAVGKVRGKVNEYDKLVGETVTRNTAIAKDRHDLDATAAEYMTNCNEFLTHQNRLMIQELGGQAEADSSHSALAAHNTPAAGHGSSHDSPQKKVSAAGVTVAACPQGQQVLADLKEGNARFVHGTSTRSNLDGQRRDETATKGQKPRATILACSDSRVPVEAIFDKGVGDLFLIRVAGNICGQHELGSIEYGVDHLETPLLIILGHSGCGAVTAAATSATVHGSIPSLIDEIAPALERCRHHQPQPTGGALISACIDENVWVAVERTLTRSAAIRQRVKEGKVLVVGANYDLAQGTIRWMGPHPRQNELLAAALDAPTHGPATATHAAPTGSAQQLERLRKITLVNDIIDLGSAARIACFKSQALRQPDLIKNADKNFPQIAEKLKSLRDITRLKEDLDRIDKVEHDANKYRAAMNNLLANWLALQDVASRRGEVAENVLSEAQETAKAGLTQATTIANETTSSLSTAAMVVVIGLCVAMIVGVALALGITRSITGPINRVIAGLSSGAEQTSSAAGQVSAASQSLAQGSS
ncbi:MAG: carbonic anhydrase, partial [Planctomycetaceae bacterium]